LSRKTLTLKTLTTQSKLVSPSKAGKILFGWWKTIELPRFFRQLSPCDIDLFPRATTELLRSQINGVPDNPAKEAPGLAFGCPAVWFSFRAAGA
jgi:hypothetical protein